MNHREKIEWCDLWVEEGETTSLPRILILGDSVARSYYPQVSQQLSGRFACARVATSKCVGDPAFARELELVLNDYSFSIIHFNNGRHGRDYSEDFYANGLAEALDLLISHCGADHLFWATSTPSWAKDGSGTHDAFTQRVKERNRIAAILAKERALCINDLYSAVASRPELYSRDGVHFNEEGRVVLGDRVAAAIESKWERSEPKSR